MPDIKLRQDIVSCLFMCVYVLNRLFLTEDEEEDGGVEELGNYGPHRPKRRPMATRRLRRGRRREVGNNSPHNLENQDARDSSYRPVQFTDCISFSAVVDNHHVTLACQFHGESISIDAICFPEHSY